MSYLTLYPKSEDGVQHGDVVTADRQILGSVSYSPQKDAWLAIAGAKIVRDHLDKIVWMPSAPEAAELVEGGYRS